MKGRALADAFNRHLKIVRNSNHKGDESVVFLLSSGKSGKRLKKYL